MCENKLFNFFFALFCFVEKTRYFDNNRRKAKNVFEIFMFATSIKNQTKTKKTKHAI